LEHSVKAYRNLLVYVGRDDDQLPAIFLLGMKPECPCDSQQFFHASQDPPAVFNIAIYQYRFIHARTPFTGSETAE
jgi:hypothetical protein